MVLKNKTGLFFYPYKRRKTLNPNPNIRSNIRISRTEFLSSNIRFSEYEYSSVENTGAEGGEGTANQSAGYTYGGIRRLFAKYLG